MTHNNNKNHRITKNFFRRIKRNPNIQTMWSIFSFSIFVCFSLYLEFNLSNFFLSFIGNIVQIFFCFAGCSKKNQVVTTNSSHQFFCLFSLWFNVKAKVENEINDHYMYTLIIVNNNNNNKRKNNRKNVCVFNIRLSIN